MTEVLAEGILNFWFGDLDRHGLASTAHQKQWFAKDDTFDERIRKLYGSLLELAPMGAYDRWTLDPKSRVALLVLMDQFSRNLFRNKPRSFYCDAKCQVIALAGIEKGEHETLALSHAYFLIMPLMHAEDINLQNRCVELFQGLAARSEGEGKALAQNGEKFAKLHRDIILRFGRFPHRNAILGRDSTPEEKEFLANGGPTF